MRRNFFAGLSISSFLRRHWQKRLLLVRQALPEYRTLLTRHVLFELATRDDTQSRLVSRRGAHWAVEHGPFSLGRLRRLPPRGWTLLVQGVNHVLPGAQSLLLEFNFLPYARLDDVMVSYAPAGGGVGPHFDSYDVFLLQIAGARRWRVSHQRDLSLVADAPLRLLKHFRAEREWVLEPGDMLYLPPHVAHDGTAVDDCLTASIGFRAPAAQELATQFLAYLQEEIVLDGLYRDPALRATRHPARIGRDMLQQAQRMLSAIDWRARDVLEFLGRYLTEPKMHITFKRPAKALAPAQFARRAAKSGVALHLKTLMLFHGRTFFINGDRHRVGARTAALLRSLADERRLMPALVMDADASRLLYQWYRAGYIVLREGP